MTKISFTTLRILCGAMLLTASLKAEDQIAGAQPAEQTTEGQSQDVPLHPDNKKHVPVGTRMMAHAERVCILEEQALAQKSGESKDLIEQQNKSNKNGKLNGLKNALGANASSAKYIPGKAFGYTTHTGALHYPFAVSVFGDRVELEDGSVWTVRSGDTYKTLNWLTSDLIVMTPNQEWFTVYNYKLTNQNTGVSVGVNLELGPIYNGTCTHWIIAIDKANNKVCLEDGSIWEMSNDDYRVVNKWLINDTVIIGVNDGWLSSYRPNILLNVNTLNHARCTCIY